MANESNRKVIAGRSVRWDEARARNAYARGLWVRDTLAATLRQAARQTPERVLIVAGEQRLDCQTLYSHSVALAQYLLERASPGSVIAFMTPNWHEAAVIYMAATFAGMVINPVLPSMRDHELRFILEDADCRMVFIPAALRQQDYVAMLERVCAQLPKPPDVVVLRGNAGRFVAYDSLITRTASARSLPTVDPDSIRMLMYTSGTTGRPKGVLHSHNSIHALIAQIREHWFISPGDKFLVPSPIGHIGGSIYAFECPLLAGTTALLMEKWNADEAVRIMVEEGCTHMAGPPAFLEQILSAARRAGTRLPSLKVFVCGGASVPPSLIRSAQQYFERAIVTRIYGSTEVPIATVGALRREEAAFGADTDGRAGLAQIELADHPAAPFGEGEICVQGPQMLMGYLRAEDERDAFDNAGLFRTGDIGRWVADVYLVVTARAKDIIIRNGENIAPKEIEDLLLDHPNIEQIAIVGVPDSRTGERCCAVIVPKTLPGPDVSSLRAFLDDKGVAVFKVPEQVVIAASLPRNDGGKVLKHELRASLAQQSG